MRKYLLVMALALTSNVAQAQDRFSLKDQDTQLHIASSYGLALTSTLILKKAEVSKLNSILLASALTMLLGTAKETLLDDAYSSSDQWANFAGTALSAGMVFTFDF